MQLSKHLKKNYSQIKVCKSFQNKSFILSEKVTFLKSLCAVFKSQLAVSSCEKLLAVSFSAWLQAKKSHWNIVFTDLPASAGINALPLHSTWIYLPILVDVAPAKTLKDFGPVRHLGLTKKLEVWKGFLRLKCNSPYCPFDEAAETAGVVKPALSL